MDDMNQVMEQAAEVMDTTSVGTDVLADATPTSSGGLYVGKIVAIGAAAIGGVAATVCVGKKVVKKAKAWWAAKHPKKTEDKKAETPPQTPEPKKPEKPEEGSIDIVPDEE